MRSYPHPEFSLAKRTISASRSGAMRGLPGEARNLEPSNKVHEKAEPKLHHGLHTSHRLLLSLLSLLKRPVYPRGDKGRERTDVAVDACAIQRLEISVAIFDPDNSPRITARCEYRIHQEARHAPVAVGVWVYIAEQPMTEDGARAGLRLVFKKIEQRRHCIAYRLQSGRDLAGGPQVNRIV